MKKLGTVEWLALVLVVIGGLNWGLVGAFNFNLVSAIFGASVLANIIYVLVGLSAIYVLSIASTLSRR